MWVCLCVLHHLEKKLCWPVDVVSPSYESLCLRLSGGPPWQWPSLGAEMSMLLLLSLLLELRPGLDSPRWPELSWEKAEKCTAYFRDSRTRAVSCSRKLHVIRWELMCFPRWAVECGGQNCACGRVNLLDVSGFEMRRGGKRREGNMRFMQHRSQGQKMTSCFREEIEHNHYAEYLPRAAQKIIKKPWEIFRSTMRNKWWSKHKMCWLLFTTLILKNQTKVLPLEQGKFV